MSTENKMTNAEAKQEAIKKAYGEHFNLLENFIDSNGEVCKAMCPDNTQNIFGNIFWDNLNGNWWPKTLNGIQNNNGWIRIEPDGSNLPENMTHNLFRGFHHIDGELPYTKFDSQGINRAFYKKEITHYKPIPEEPKPLY